MTPLDILLAAGLVAVIVVCGVVTWALRETVQTLRSARATSESLRATSDEIRERALPLLEKIDVTVDAINVELLRVDAIITSVEDATERVSSASGTISGMVNAPAEIVNDMIGRVRRAWKDRRHEPPTPPGPAERDDTAPEPDAARPPAS